MRSPGIAVRDIAIALRRLRRTPRTSLLALLTLTSGMSLALVAFDMVASAVLRPPPGVSDNAALMRVLVEEESTASEPWRKAMVVSLEQFEVLRQTLDGALELAAYAPVSVVLADGRSAPALLVTERYFTLLGVGVASGRLDPFRSADVIETGVVASARLSTELLARSSRRGSRSLEVNGIVLPLFGVADAAFAGLEPPAADVWIHASAALAVPGMSRLLDGRTTAWSVVGARRPGIGEARLNDALRRAETALQDADWRPDVAYRLRRASLLSPRGGHGLPLAEQLPTILLVLSTVVLAIAIMNLSGLQLSQAIERRRELALRIALGARRRDLLRVHLAEAGLVAVAGAALSIVGVWLVHPLARRLVPSLHSNATDWRLTSAAIGITMVSAAIVAFVPVVHALRQRPRTELHENAYSRSAGRWNRSIVAVQAALAIVIVTVTGVLLASVRAVEAIPLGFDRDGILVGTIELAATERMTARLPVVETDPGSLSRESLLGMRDAARRLTGIEAASLATGAPSGRLGAVIARRRGADDVNRDGLGAILNFVDDQFFATAGLRVRRGRTFTAWDLDHTFAAAVISSTMAEQLFGGADPVGECIAIGGADRSASAGDCTTVIGVVDDAKYLSVVEPTQPTVYLPLSRNVPLQSVALYLRRVTAGNVSAGAILRLMREADPRTVTAELRSLNEIVAPQVARYKLASTAAFLLSTAGIVMLVTGFAAHLRVVFAARRKEIGVRLALGARATDLGRFVGRDLLLGIGIGSTAGAVLGASAIRYVRPLLYGVTGFEVWAYGIAVGVVLMVTLLAIGAPAIRMSRRPPLDALR